MHQRNRFGLTNHLELLICVKARKIGSQLLLAHSSSNVLSGRGSEEEFNECLGVSNVCSLSSLCRLPTTSGEVTWESCSTALLSGVRDISKV